MQTDPSHIEFEKAVMAMMLAGDDPVLEALRAQYETSTVTKRMFSGVGFVTDFSLPKEVTPVPGKSLFFISDIGADLNGAKGAAGLHLQIKGGRLKVLEGFTYSDPWPIHLANYELYYKYAPALEEQNPGRAKTTRLLEIIAREWRSN